MTAKHPTQAELDEAQLNALVDLYQRTRRDQEAVLNGLRFEASMAWLRYVAVRSSARDTGNASLGNEVTKVALEDVAARLEQLEAATSDSDEAKEQLSAALQEQGQLLSARRAAA